MKKVRISDLRKMKQAGEKIACLTAYDAVFADLSDQAGMDVLLVGDSLGMVVQGAADTLGVRMSDMVYHTRMVTARPRRAMVLADMPFMSDIRPQQALGNAARLLGEGRAEGVKLEGGRERADAVRLLSERGIAVCGHLGLLPQSVHRLGGYLAQGTRSEAARRIQEDARILQQAGAMLLVLECVPAALAARIQAELDIPVIGIGAGAECDGQILVLHDMLGIGKKKRFVEVFLRPGSGQDIAGALRLYVQAVKDGSFPRKEHEAGDD